MSAEVKWQKWLENPPDYYEMQEAYTQAGELEAACIRLKRRIADTEDGITVDIDKPRSTESRKAKLKATVDMKNELAEIEAQLTIIEHQIKILEFKKSMINSATYALKMML